MTEASKKLTIKQSKFVNEYVKNDGNGKKAAQIAYDVANDATAAVIASENLTKPNIKAAIEASLVKHGITLDAAVKPIAEALNAERVVIVGNGDQAMAELVPDHNVRLKASGMAIKLMGADKEDGGGNTFNFNFKGGATFNASEYKK